MVEGGEWRVESEKWSVQGGESACSAGCAGWRGGVESGEPTLLRKMLMALQSRNSIYIVTAYSHDASSGSARLTGQR